MNAECLEIEGINICICLSGFEGNGQNCTGQFQYNDVYLATSYLHCVIHL